MSLIKSGIFNYLTKNQKSEICHVIKIFTKKHFDKTTDKIFVEEILNLFLEDEQYYLEINQSRYPWLKEQIDNEIFIKELKLYINENLKQLKQKEKQKPFIEKQKQYAKEQRQKAQIIKMSKEPPTKKQISYYKALCKKNSIEAEFLNNENISKLDYKNAIDMLLNKDFQSDKDKLNNELNKLLLTKKLLNN